MSAGRGRRARSVVTVGPGVTFVEGPVSNWVVVAEDDGIALIDAGYPADAPLVLESLRAAGHDPADLRRIWITHGHVDHVGGIPGVLADPALRGAAVEVLAHDAELPNVRGPEREQATLGTIGGRVAAPRVASWLTKVVRAGALGPVANPKARAFGPDDLDGRSVEPVPMPGHTAGSTAYRLASVDALVTGDAVVTHHDVMPRRWAPRPRLITPLFTEDLGRARDSASATVLPSIVLPGHGPAMRRDGAGWVPLG